MEILFSIRTTNFDQSNFINNLLTPQRQPLHSSSLALITYIQADYFVGFVTDQKLATDTTNALNNLKVTLTDILIVQKIVEDPVVYSREVFKNPNQPIRCFYLLNSKFRQWWENTPNHRKTCF